MRAVPQRLRNISCTGSGCAKKVPPKEFC